MAVVVTIDLALSRYASSLARLGDGQARRVMGVALRAGGSAVRSAMVEAGGRQTNLPVATIDRAFHAEMIGDTVWRVRSSGGDIRFKYFGAKEGGGGVSASPWGKPAFRAGAFITSGRPGARRAARKLNGHVFERVDKSATAWRGKIRFVRSGLFIPTEMTTGATFAAFERGASRVSGAVLAQVAAALP